MHNDSAWFPLVGTVVLSDLWLVALAQAMREQRLNFDEIPDNLNYIMSRERDLKYLLTCNWSSNPFGMQRPKVDHSINVEFVSNMYDWVGSFKAHHMILISHVRQSSYHFISEYQGITEDLFKINFNIWFNKYFDIHHDTSYGRALRLYTHHHLFEQEKDTNSLFEVWFLLWTHFAPHAGGIVMDTKYAWLDKSQAAYASGV